MREKKRKKRIKNRKILKLTNLQKKKRAEAAHDVGTLFLPETSPGEPGGGFHAKVGGEGVV